MLVQVFELCSLHSFFNYNFLVILIFFDQGLELRVIGGRHPSFALRAVEIVKDNTRSIVLLLYLTLYAVDVVDMSTLQVNTWLLSQA